jgi:hypothetical protein
MDRGLAWTIGSAGLAFVALGCALFNWAYFVYVGPNPNIFFASLIAVAGLLLVFAGLMALRYVAVAITNSNTDRAHRRVPFFATGRGLIVALLIGLLPPAFLWFYQTSPPRLLYPDEERSMIDQLKKIKQPGRVQILRDEDEECRALADQYSQLFATAGWRQVSDPRVSERRDKLRRLNRGMNIYRFNLDRPSLQFVAILYNMNVNYARIDDYDLYDSDYFILSISDAWY